MRKFSDLSKTQLEIARGIAFHELTVNFPLCNNIKKRQQKISCVSLLTNIQGRGV